MARQTTPATIVAIKLAAFVIAAAWPYILVYHFGFKGPFWEWGSIALAVLTYFVAKIVLSISLGYLWGREDAKEVKRWLAALPPDVKHDVIEYAPSDANRVANVLNDARQIDGSLSNRADTLVRAARMNAISMFTPLLDQFSFLRQVDPKHWDFVVTVAGVFIATTRLRNLRLGEDREQRLMDKVSERFTQLDPDNSDRCFENCKSFFERNYDSLTKAGHEPMLVASDSIGLWIVWNILGRSPQADEEWKLVRVIGGMITHAFFNWWTDGV